MNEARVEVTQEDREAAARVYQDRRDHDYACWIRDGTSAGGDSDFFVQAFARHRIAALTRSSKSTVSDDVVERLRIMSKQRLSSEMGEDDLENADWQGAYDHFVTEGRAIFAALTEQPLYMGNVALGESALDDQIDAIMRKSHLNINDPGEKTYTTGAVREMLRAALMPAKGGER